MNIELDQFLDRIRSAGKKAVFTNGCFDILHAGHVQYLQWARSQGDCLVVGLNSDRSVRELKGPSRPVHQESDRKLILEALKSVDFVQVFDTPTPLELITYVRPHILVKGADYKEADVVGGDFVKSLGGEVRLAPLLDGRSTSAAIAKMRKN